jgi:poly(ADP-ribose) glycohydrolase ARH3
VDEVLSDRTRAALLGVALGDALGRPFEGVPRPDAAEVMAWAESTERLTWTDDTAMTLVLAEHLVAAAPWDDLRLDELVGRFAEAWQREPWRGYGGGPPRIFAAHLAGQPWRDASRALFGRAGSFGNGGAMRVAPVALVAPSLEDGTRLARDSAVVTHAHPLGQDGAAVQAAAVFLALNSGDGPLDRDGFVAELHGVAQTPEFTRAIDLLHRVPVAADPHALAALLGNGIEAERSVPTAIAAFLAQPDDLRAAILTAVCCGGDADTIAAMTGAIAGARHGTGSLPQSWLARLEDYDRIERLGTALVRVRR